MTTLGLAVRNVAILAFLGMTGCRAESPHYIFVLPDGYSGSIQVIFDSRRAPGEKYQIDVPEDDPHPGMISPEAIG